MKRKFRIYRVLEGDKERQYFTNSANRVLDFPFKGYLWDVSENEHTKNIIALGKNIVINDSTNVFHNPKYPALAKVLNVELCNDLDIKEPDLRLYLLSKGKYPIRRVIVANKQNLIYNHYGTNYYSTRTSIPEALVNTKTGFSDELFEISQKVEIRPIFSGENCHELFSVEDSRIITYDKYMQFKLFNDKEENKIYDRYNYLISKLTNPESIRRFEEEKKRNLKRIKELPTLEQRLEREFFGGDLQ